MGGLLGIRMHSLAVVTIHIGRRNCFQPWCDWLTSVTLPIPSSLYLVDNSGDPDFGRMMAETLANPDHGRFTSATILPGPGPSSRKNRSAVERYQNTADALTIAISATREDLVLIIDDDTIPDADCIEKLVAEFRRKRVPECGTESKKGMGIGAISGCYESARAPGFLVAARSPANWTDRPRVGELGGDEVIEVGLTGHGCFLIDGNLLRRMLPIVRSHGGMGGPDGYICQQVREQGYSLWLHGGVQCRHLFEPQAAAE